MKMQQFSVFLGLSSSITAQLELNVKLEDFKGSINSQTASKNGHVVVAFPVCGSTERRAVPRPFLSFLALGLGTVSDADLTQPAAQGCRAVHKKMGCLHTLFWLLRIK